jgi:hypothetical protein
MKKSHIKLGAGNPPFVLRQAGLKKCYVSMNVHGGKVENAVRDVVVDLWDWNCNMLGDLGKRIKKAKRALKSCRSDQLNARNVTREHVLKYILEKLEDQKDLHWRQRAHVLWLKMVTTTPSFSISLLQKGGQEIKLQD